MKIFTDAVPTHQIVAWWSIWKVSTLNFSQLYHETLAFLSSLMTVFLCTPKFTKKTTYLSGKSLIQKWGKTIRSRQKISNQIEIWRKWWRNTDFVSLNNHWLLWLLGWYRLIPLCCGFFFKIVSSYSFEL